MSRPKANSNFFKNWSKEMAYILGFIVLKEAILTFSTWNPAWESFFRNSIYMMMLLTVGLTLYSGLSYLWENRKVITKL